MTFRAFLGGTHRPLLKPRGSFGPEGPPGTRRMTASFAWIGRFFIERGRGRFWPRNNEFNAVLIKRGQKKAPDPVKRIHYKSNRRLYLVRKIANLRYMRRLIT